MTNKFRLNFLIYWKKKLIVTKENAKDKKIEIKFKNEKFISLDKITFLSPKIETAAKVGIDNKKDIFAAS